MAKTKNLLLDAMAKIDPATKLIGPVERWKLKTEAEKPPYIPLGYHPSGLSVDGCARALVLAQLGVKSSDLILPRVHRIFQVGTDLHRDWQRHLVAAGVVQPWQVEVPLHKIRTVVPDDVAQGLGIPLGLEIPKSWQKRMEKVVARAARHELRGHIDCVLGDSKGTGPLAVGEFKSMNGRTYDTYAKKGMVMAKHLGQASVYAWALEATEIVFLYECKDDQTPTEISIAPDKKAVEEIFRIVTEARTGLAAGQLPERHEKCPSKSSSKASACPFQRACFSEMTFVELDNRAGIEPRDYR